VQFNASGSGVSDFCHYSAIIDTCFELWMEVTYQMESWTLVRFRWWEVRGWHDRFAGGSGNGQL